MITVYDPGIESVTPGTSIGNMILSFRLVDSSTLRVTQGISVADLFVGRPRKTGMAIQSEGCLVIHSVIVEWWLSQSR